MRSCLCANLWSCASESRCLIACLCVRLCELVGTCHAFLGWGSNVTARARLPRVPEHCRLCVHAEFPLGRPCGIFPCVRELARCSPAGARDEGPALIRVVSSDRDPLTAQLGPARPGAGPARSRPGPAPLPAESLLEYAAGRPEESDDGIHPQPQAGGGAALTEKLKHVEGAISPRPL